MSLKAYSLGVYDDYSRQVLGDKNAVMQFLKSEERKKHFDFCDVFSDTFESLSITDFERARVYVKISDGCDNHWSSRAWCDPWEH